MITTEAHKTYKITLDDYHPGEYTNFSDWAERRNRLIDRYKAEDLDDTSPWANLPHVQATLVENDDEVAEGTEPDGADRWELEGTPNQLRELYHELLVQLATPAWHWYGMGGDDHAFDYWPNTMALAVQFRDALLEIASGEPDDCWAKHPYHTTYVTEDLNRVYWACRTRWEQDEAKTVPGHEYPGTFDDFLAADEFGDRP